MYFLYRNLTSWYSLAVYLLQFNCVSNFEIPSRMNNFSSSQCEFYQEAKPSQEVKDVLVLVQLLFGELGAGLWHPRVFDSDQ